jgi:hypothetical protein
MDPFHNISRAAAISAEEAYGEDLRDARTVYGPEGVSVVDLFGRIFTAKLANETGIHLMDADPLVDPDSDEEAADINAPIDIDPFDSEGPVVWGGNRFLWVSRGTEQYDRIMDALQKERRDPRFGATQVSPLQVFAPFGPQVGGNMSVYKPNDKAFLVRGLNEETLLLRNVVSGVEHEFQRTDASYAALRKAIQEKTRRVTEGLRRITG